MSPKTKVEGRSSKFEVGSAKKQPPGAAELEAGAFWTWGEDIEGGLLLREGGFEGKNGCELANGAELEERAARFAETVIGLARGVSEGPVTNRIIAQLVGAATSIGANYAEARDGVSRKDFRNRVGTSRKEARETMFFLRMLAAAEPARTGEIRALWREAREINRIFGAIWRKTGE